MMLLLYAIKFLANSSYICASFDEDDIVKIWDTQ